MRCSYTYKSYKKWTASMYKCCSIILLLSAKALRKVETWFLWSPKFVSGIILDIWTKTSNFFLDPPTIPLMIFCQNILALIMDIWTRKDAYWKMWVRGEKMSNVDHSLIFGQKPEFWSNHVVAWPQKIIFFLGAWNSKKAFFYFCLLLK